MTSTIQSLAAVGADWTLGPAPIDGGVAFHIGLPTLGVQAVLNLTREEARAHAYAVLAAAGDATHRTFIDGSGKAGG